MAPERICSSDIWPDWSWLPWEVDWAVSLPCALDVWPPLCEGLPWALDWLCEPLGDCDAEAVCEDCELDCELLGELDCELLCELD